MSVELVVAQTLTRQDPALERTRIAHERTLMTWIRRSMSMVTFDFTIYEPDTLLCTSKVPSFDACAIADPGVGSVCDTELTHAGAARSRSRLSRRWAPWQLRP